MYDSMIFYKSFADAIDELPTEYQLEAYKAIIRYAFTGQEQDISGLAKIPYVMAKPQIDANIKRKSNGYKGGRPKKTNGYENEKPMVIKEKTNGYENEKPNVNVNDNANVNDNVNANANANANDIKDIPNNVQDVVDLYHTLCPSLPKVRVITNKRIKTIKSFLKQYDIETIKEAFEKAEASDFMKGKNNRGWKADIDFLTNANSVAKVLEDKYKNKQTDTTTGTNNNFFDEWANA